MGVHVSYPFHTPLLKSPFHTLFHTPDLNKRFIPLLSIVSYPVSYPVSNPVKVCCRNHADVSKGMFQFNFQHNCQSLNFQHVSTLLHTSCIPCLVGSERAFGCVCLFGKRAFGKRAFGNARSGTHCVRTAFGERTAFGLRSVTTYARSGTFGDNVCAFGRVRAR